MTAKIKNGIEGAIIHIGNLFILIWLVKYMMTYLPIPELNSSLFSERHNSSMFSIVTISILYIVFFLIFSSFKMKKIFVNAAVCVLIGLGVFFMNDARTLQIDAMHDRYTRIQQESPQFIASDYGFKLKAASDSNDIPQFVEILSHTNNTSSILDTEIITLLNVINDVTPNLKDNAKSILNDNFVSKQEYLDIKADILKSINTMTLTSDQIAMLRSFK